MRTCGERAHLCACTTVRVRVCVCAMDAPPSPLMWLVSAVKAELEGQEHVGMR